MKQFFILLLLASFFIASAPSVIGQEETKPIECPEDEVNLVVAAGAVGRELEVTNEIFEKFMALCPNVKVSALESPDLATDRLSLYIQFLGTRSAAVDIYQIDIPWIGILQEHMVDLYQYAPPDSEIIAQHFPAIIDNNTVDGKLVGMPWFTDAGLLYFRTDLIEKYGLVAPTTWNELEVAARTIQDGEREQGNSEFWGYVWQGNVGEPTTINALEWQASNGGGVIVAPDGTIQVNNPPTIAAIERARDWIGEISPPTVIGHTPEASRAIWQAGNAAFMRNWPYAYNLGNADDSPIKGLFDVSALPAGDAGIRTGVLGGWQLSVSRYSNNPDAAAALVLYMTSQESQKLRAIELGNAPTIQTLYDDAEILEAVPFLTGLREALLNATPRPSTVTGERYNDVSRLYSNAVHSVLRGEKDARTAMEDLEFDLEDLLAQINIVAEAPTDQAIEATPEVVAEAQPTETGGANADEQPTSNQEVGDDNTLIIVVIIGVFIVAGGAYFLTRRNKRTTD